MKRLEKKFFVIRNLYICSMKNNKIEDILNMIGAETIVICRNHNDNCSCHNVINEAA